MSSTSRDDKVGGPQTKPAGAEVGRQDGGPQGRWAANSITWSDLSIAAAVDPEIYYRTFHPKTFRQSSPPFVSRLNDLLESPRSRFVNLQLFRGSSKTTRSRAYMGRRIVYGSSRVILCVCASAAKAELSVRWVKNQVTGNRLWASTFGLEPGDTWRDWQIEVKNRLLGQSTWVLAFGLEGSHRGINIDDWRPDLIFIDDIIDEENSASIEQRNKARDLVLGNLIYSLAPIADNPESKLIVAQTPFHKEDFSMKSLRDPRFHSLQQGCWTEETKDLPLELRQSVWEERFPTAELQAAKRAAIIQNEGSKFSREMEVRLVTPESSAFLPHWLKRIRPDEVTPDLLKGMFISIGIDPVPPPRPQAIEKDLHKKDFEAITAVGYKGLDYYILETVASRGHDPLWTIGELFRMIYKWNPKQIVLETIAYQATLEWLIREAMAKQRRFVPINGYRDRRSKYDRIVDAFSGPGSHGHLYVVSDNTGFIEQFEDYPKVSNDDILDSAAMAIDGMKVIELDDDGGNWGDPVSEPSVEGRISFHRGSP